MQDRPEQNAGYDAAVAGDSTATPQTTVDDWVERDGSLTIRRIPDELPAEERPVENADDRAERDVIAEIRRRERRRARG